MNKKIELLAISVGQPQEFIINERSVTTSIIKTPVKGPVAIKQTGPEGDKPSFHPDPVYAYPVEHYDYWGKELDVDATQWGYGYFGENLTIRGIDETQIRIGDQLHIGSTVKLQVISSRSPCFKLCWRLGQSTDFLKRFSLSGKVGFYLNVLQEGDVKGGDPVKHVQLDPNAMTIVELARFFVDIDKATEKQLRLVLSHEHLSRNSQDRVRRRLQKFV